MDGIFNFIEPIFLSPIGIAVILISIITLITFVVLKSRKANKCISFKTQESCNNNSADKCIWSNDKCLSK